MDEAYITRELGRRVRRFRQAAGLSQEKLGLAADVSQPYISSLESGQRNAGIVLITKLACALGVRVADITDPEAYPLLDRSRTTRH